MLGGKRLARRSGSQRGAFTGIDVRACQTVAGIEFADVGDQGDRRGGGFLG